MLFLGDLRVVRVQMIAILGWDDSSRIIDSVLQTKKEIIQSWYVYFWFGRFSFEINDMIEG
jgi:hypothetical protein